MTHDDGRSDEIANTFSFVHSTLMASSFVH